MIITLTPTAAARHAPLLLHRLMMILGTAAADASQTEVLRSRCFDLRHLNPNLRLSGSPSRHGCGSTVGSLRCAQAAA
jgi:hypothetical protein